MCRVGPAWENAYAGGWLEGGRTGLTEQPHEGRQAGVSQSRPWRIAVLGVVACLAVAGFVIVWVVTTGIDDGGLRAGDGPLPPVGSAATLPAMYVPSGQYRARGAHVSTEYRKC